MRDTAGDLDVRSPLELGPERPVTDEEESPLPHSRERVREPNDVFALDQTPDANEDRAIVDLPGARHRTCPKEIEVDPAIDDLGLAARLRDLRLQLPAEVVRDRDQGRGPPSDVAGRRADPWIGADVADVAAVGGRNQRRAREQRRGEPGRDEEVGIDDVRPEAPSNATNSPERMSSEMPSTARMVALPMW